MHLNFINIFKKKPHRANSRKIIHITRFFEKKKYGGIEEVIRQISLKSKYKHEILSISSKRKNVKISKNLFSKTFVKSFKIFGDFFSYDLLKYLYYSKNEYNIIHIHYPHVFAFLYILLLPIKKNIIVTHHSDILKYKFIYFFVYLIKKFTLKYINYFHISSKTYFKNSEIKNYKNKTLIEFFSIKPNKKKIKVKSNKKYVLFISRVSHYKGFNLLEKIINGLPKINFICITNYKFKKKFKNVKIYKNISNLKKIFLIANCRIILSTSTSRGESFGMSLVEGLSMNKPLIAFDIKTGINELIKNKKNGFLIKNFNIEEYCKRIKLIYENDNLFRKFSKYSKSHYNLINTKYKKLERVYDSLI
jgi:rhamnosyl/mannosyltransferase